jgi:hypothetical protein
VQRQADYPDLWTSNFVQNSAGQQRTVNITMTGG